MSAAPAVTMEELELERAELPAKPGDQTLCVVSHHQPHLQLLPGGVRLLALRARGTLLPERAGNAASTFLRPLFR